MPAAQQLARLGLLLQELEQRHGDLAGHLRPVDRPGERLDIGERKLRIELDGKTDQRRQAVEYLRHHLLDLQLDGFHEAQHTRSPGASFDAHQSGASGPRHACPMFSHVDALGELSERVPLERKLATIHAAVRGELPFVDRVAVASYDPATGLLKTLLASPQEGNALVRYEARLADSPTLAEMARTHRPRVVNDLELFRGGERRHTRAIAAAGLRSSYTVPMLLDGSFWGLVFFNSRVAGALTEAALRRLDGYAHLICALVIAERLSVRVLAAAVKTAHDMVHYRDLETGAHIDRMARFARLIAQELAATGAAALNDAAIERLFEFAPLHDIGKIALPDRILLKPGRLTPEEREAMQRHTVRGREMVDALARNFGLEELAGLDVLRHIAELHHEALDGSGYPHGLKQDEIALEARIVAVADAFDALTSARPYKPAWSNEQALAWLRGAARAKFDQQCVAALAASPDRVAAIQAQFKDADR